MLVFSIQPLRPFQQYTVILGRWADDNERLCVVEPRLRSKT